MRITTSVEERVRARQHADRIAERLRAEFERELQSTPAALDTADASAQRDALERAVRRLLGSAL